jgi:aspartyl aminopeptidase
MAPPPTPDGGGLDPRPVAGDLLGFIDASPSPYHAVAEVARRLDAAGFERLDERAGWRPAPSRAYVARGGTVVAWAGADDPAQIAEGFRIVGAHTDSPNLRVKPRPDTGSAGYRQLGVEVYGGALRNSWLDRDLGLSGRVGVVAGDRIDTRLLRVDRPLLRIPQLAIHLDRGVNDGLTLNPQVHLTPVWGLAPGSRGAGGRGDAPAEGDFRAFVARELAVDPGDVLGWEIMVHDLTPSTLLGSDDELLSAPRIDNLLSCHAATTALLAAADDETTAVPVICLFDHEEVGSQSASGADGAVLPTILERVVTAAGGDRDAFHRAVARSVCLSADGAHGTHPNYPERHEPGHPVRLNGGPVLKLNSNVRYATDAESGAVLELAARRAEVPLQRFVVRSDLPCGSTIGPVTAARLGIPTVDVGVAQLAMHSARELCGAADPAAFVRLLLAFLAGGDHLGG